MKPLSNAKCPKCESINLFKAEEIEVAGYNYKLTAIMCAKCNTVVTFMEYFNIGVLIKKIHEFLKIN
jgi:phage FluMu protein Com